MDLYDEIRGCVRPWVLKYKPNFKFLNTDKFCIFVIILFFFFLFFKFFEEEEEEDKEKKCIEFLCLPRMFILHLGEDLIYQRIYFLFFFQI